LNKEPILCDLSNVAWSSTTEGAQTDYEHDLSHLSNYGLCPMGWLVPCDDEFQDLEIHLGMPESVVNNTGWQGGPQNMGGQIKEAGTDHWGSPNSRASPQMGLRR